jgi:Fic family protein
MTTIHIELESKKVSAELSRMEKSVGQEGMYTALIMPQPRRASHPATRPRRRRKHTQGTPDSRHFLPPERRRLRRFTPDGLLITGTAYLPPQAEDRGVDFIANEFNRLLFSAEALTDAVNQSFFIFTRIPYLQPFYDADKRTARIGCNLPLLLNGLSPITFIDSDKKQYLKSMVAFYELGDERLAKDVFLEAALLSAFRYVPSSEAAKIEFFSDRQGSLAAAKQYVLEGTLLENYPWLHTAPEDDLGWQP